MDGGMDYLSQQLPNELLHNIFKHLDPLDLGNLGLVCKPLNLFIKKNPQLYKEIYLNILDEPEQCDNWDWEDRLRKLLKFRSILGSNYGSVEKRMAQISFISDFITSMTKSTYNGSTSLNTSFLVNLFDNNQNAEAFYCQSELYVRARKDQDILPLPTFKQRQASAKIHTMNGVPVRSICRTKYRYAYPYAVSKVYDLRNYTRGTLWGPFLDDGQASVDWEKMEAIMILLEHNLREFSTTSYGSITTLWVRPWSGCWPGSYRSSDLLQHKARARPEVDFEDPYNITGSWMRIVCFLDFHELFHYNFTGPRQPDGVPRPPLETVEAIRLIMMDLYVTKKEDPGPEDGQDYPIVHFSGTARSMHSSWDPNANSNIRGTVRQTKEGEIRWTSISVYNGEERWKSEGIQVGGVKSGRGVLGHWFDREWDIHGPAGPTAFWKISDDLDEDKEKDDDSYHHHHHHILNHLEDMDGEDDTEEEGSEEDEDDDDDDQNGQPHPLSSF